MAVVHIVDVAIPTDDIELAMRISDKIEGVAGPADTGIGFGWRDLSIQCRDATDATIVVALARQAFSDAGMPFSEGADRQPRMAHVAMRTVDPDAEEE